MANCLRRYDGHCSRHGFGYASSVRQRCCRFVHRQSTLNVRRRCILVYAWLTTIASAVATAAAATATTPPTAPFALFADFNWPRLQCCLWLLLLTWFLRLRSYFRYTGNRRVSNFFYPRFTLFVRAIALIAWAALLALWS